MRLPLVASRLLRWAILAAVAGGTLTAWLFVMVGVVPPDLKSSDPAGSFFQLVASDGRLVPRSELRRRPTAWVFGFTRCGNRCLDMLDRIDDLASRLDASSKPINFVFVTIDPEHDTPSVLRRFLSGHTPMLTALITSRATVESMANHFRVAYGGSTSTHGFPAFADLSRIFLTDGSGRLVEAVELDEPAEVGLAEIHAVTAAR